MIHVRTGHGHDTALAGHDRPPEAIASRAKRRDDTNPSNRNRWPRAGHGVPIIRCECRSTPNEGRCALPSRQAGAWYLPGRCCTSRGDTRLNSMKRPAQAVRLAPAAADLLLFTVFALHHSVFARSGLKDVVTRFVPPALERSTYVWIASVLFIAVCALWQPVPGVVWHASGGAAWLLRGVQLSAAVFTVFAARHLDILDLSGVRQALELASSRPMKLDDHGPYGLVRHPIYLAWLLMVWPTPFMNGTRFVFAATSTALSRRRDSVRGAGSTQDLRGCCTGSTQHKVRFKILPGCTELSQSRVQGPASSVRP